MHFISMLVALAMSSLMVNSSVSKAVVLPARALENNICWPKLQICVTGTACIHLEDITLTSVTTTRVKKEEEALR